MTTRDRRADAEPLDDAALWDRLVADVAPLRRPVRVRPPAPKPEGPPVHIATPPRVRAPAPMARVVPIPRGTPQPPPKPPVPFAGIDKRTADRFRKGEMPIDGIIDLHGHTLDAAFRLLERALSRAVAGGQRCLLIITGKGVERAEMDGFMPSGRGVLRELVPRWLADPINRDRVLSVTNASHRHGGGGAFYVLIRRQREK